MLGVGDAAGLQRIRKVVEAALQAAGKHVGQSVLLWSAVRQFEGAILMTMQVC